NSQNDRLRSEIGTLQDQLDELRANRATGATSVDQIASELARLRAWSGLDPVSGRGVTITVNGRIEARAVDDLLNELHNAGAEAMAIEDMRVVARTTISGRPGSLDVDGYVLDEPFRIRVIGRPETLVGSLTRASGIIAQLAATDPEATIEVEPTDEPMLLPASRRDLVPDHGRPRL
ncbi:MAG TPA: DUF881 domain-containing protein, partial [Candidatus Limnocylindrales bacterium]|nr:DUF881 domain-containing protein [Candidatus Limnocylindrales bacterium]